MGNDESKNWIFEKVLFLDPNAPPFISQEEQGRRQANREAGEDVYGSIDGAAGRGAGGGAGNRGGGVKRFTPGQTKLRTRVFRVMIDISGRSSEFQLKCSNDPMAFVLLDRNSQPLRAIPTGLVQKIQRKGNSVFCRFGTESQPKSTEAGDQILMTFNFIDSNDCTAFVDTVKLLYGIYVEEYGITRSTSRREKKGVDQNAREACPIHGHVPCHCAKGARRKQVKEPEDAKEKSAQHSAEFPVTISGKLETGATLTWLDVSPLGKSHPPKASEWRVSYVPGREPEYEVENQSESAATDWNVTLGDTLRVTDSMVGKFIQVKVIRRVKDASERLPFVYSLAVKGPVTLDDQGARDVLAIITKPNYATNIELTPEHASVIFPEFEERIEQAGSKQPYLEGVLTVTRQSISIEIPALMGPSPAELPWNCFYLTRLEATQSDLGNEEDLYLQLHLRKSKKKQIVLRIATQSERERNSLYHAVYFFKLQKSFKGFDRWIQDYERGNFAVFKQRYAKLWAAVNFYDEIVDGTEMFYSSMREPSYLSEDDSTMDGQELSFSNTLASSSTTVRGRQFQPLPSTVDEEE